MIDCEGNCNTCDNGLRDCTCYLLYLVPEVCNHEWRERGDERTANFSVTCIKCGTDGLI